MVRTVGHHLSKSGMLPPSPLEMAKLAELSRKALTSNLPEVVKASAQTLLKRRLAPDVIEAIVARRNAGERVKALCKEYGISESALRDLMTRAEASIRTTPITTEDIDAEVELY